MEIDTGAKVKENNRLASIQGCLLGTAVGDALGLPYEGLTPRRASQLLGPPNRFRFFFGRGMISDDTEHACIVAQSLIAAAGEEAKFETEVGRRLRRWFLMIPAGVGLATLRACLKLCVGVPPQKSGVFSAGNGPSMRAPIIGAATDTVDAVLRLNRLSTRITHSDPLAEHGSVAVALAAWGATRGQFPRAADYFKLVRERLAGEDAEIWLEALTTVQASLDRGETTLEFSLRFCGDRGASGYTLQSVPVAIHAWLNHRGQFSETIQAAINCGGDTDTTAAIAGGMAGCELEVSSELVDRIFDWPCNAARLRRLGQQLAETMETGIPQRPHQGFFLFQLLRNAAFAAVVISWGLRRLIPW